MNERLTALLLDATTLTIDITPPVELGEINTTSKAGISLLQLKLSFKDATHPVTLIGSPTVDGTSNSGQEMLQLTGGPAAVQKSSASGWSMLDTQITLADTYQDYNSQFNWLGSNVNDGTKIAVDPHGQRLEWVGGRYIMYGRYYVSQWDKDTATATRIRFLFDGPAASITTSRTTNTGA